MQRIVDRRIGQRRLPVFRVSLTLRPRPVLGRGSMRDGNAPRAASHIEKAALRGDGEPLGRAGRGTDIRPALTQQCDEARKVALAPGSGGFLDRAPFGALGEDGVALRDQEQGSLVISVGRLRGVRPRLCGQLAVPFLFRQLTQPHLISIQRQDFDRIMTPCRQPARDLARPKRPAFGEEGGSRFTRPRQLGMACDATDSAPDQKCSQALLLYMMPNFLRKWASGTVGSKRIIDPECRLDDIVPSNSRPDCMHR
jgi:hypothetical protein